VDTIVNTLNTYVWGFPEKLPWLVVLLLAAGLYVTVRLLLVQVRHLGHAILVVTGRYDDPDDPGDVTHFQALSTALSATVGIGNIAGVATAIHYGGPGAVFWMWVTAAFGMALKFSECTLSLHYRSFDDNGEVAGGPMYYIERGLGRSWKPLAIFFAICAVLSSFGSGNMNQANTVALSLGTDLGMSSWLVGLLLVVLVGSVILGGIRSIARVTSKVAPAMGLIYVTAALIVLMLNAGDVPGAFATIFENAFNPAAGIGGSVAGVWTMTLLWGVKRGLFSNEAGQGSAPIAHAAARTNEPVREGAVAMLEPFIDTLIICTMTALVIVITGVWDQKAPDRLTMSAATVGPIVTAAGNVDDDAAPVPDVPSVPSVIEVKVEEGVQTQLVFKAADGPIDDVRLLVANPSGDQPFTGVLVYTAADGKVVARGLDGAEVTNLVIAGNTLRNSSALTSWAFQKGLSPLGDWGNWVVTLCVFLFAVSTMISWSYYGDRCVTYLLGVRWVIVYRAFFLVFVYLGATLALETVWTLGDIALGLMTVPNLLAVILLTPKIVDLSRDYFKRMKEEGKRG
jgi:AGCS family alanine or glycine:cation symporter